MRLTSRLIGTSLATVSLIVLAASPALAAVPSNDTFGGATAIAALPFTTSLDTTEATTDLDDMSANLNCGAPATDASVWYSFTPAADTGVVVDVASSTYAAGVIVVTGSPGSFDLQTCGPGAVAFFAASGTTYYINLFDDQLDGSGTGGTLNLTVDVIPPPPSIDITLNPRAAFDAHTGTATVSGTVTCSGEAQFAFIDVELSQKVGRVATVRGFTSIDVLCDGVSHTWSAVVTPDSGEFRGGKAASVSFAVACGVFECGVDFEERTVQLSRR
ncbi:MAG: DUF6299 family protein [Micromonosporaceae bacterium]